MTADTYYRPEYRRTGDRSGIFHEYELATGKRLRIVANDVRHEKTGGHALIRIGLFTEDGKPHLLAYDTFNFDRDKDRVHLANSAVKKLPEMDAAVWDEPQMRHALDLFCAGLWQESIGEFAFEELSGQQERIAPAFMLHPYIKVGGGTILYAPPGRGKSYATLTMAVSIDAGLSTIWDVQQSRKVGVINLERSRESMMQRLPDVNAALGLDRERPLLFINARGRTLADVYDAAYEGVRRHGVEVLFLDSVSRAGMGDLKDDVPVNRIMDQLNRLCPTWLAIAHTPRADASHVFGSVMFDAAADIAVQVLSQEATEDGRLGLGFQIAKANDVRKPPLYVVALEFDDLGLSGVRKAKRGEFLEVEGGKPMQPVDLIREYLLLVGTASGTEIGKELGIDRSTVASILSKSPMFTVARKEGSSVLYAVKSERQVE